MPSKSSHVRLRLAGGYITQSRPSETASRKVTLRAYFFFIATEKYISTSNHIRVPAALTTAMPKPVTFITDVERWLDPAPVGGRDRERDAELIHLDSQPLSTQLLERGRNLTRDGCKTSFKDLHNPALLTPLPPHSPSCHSCQPSLSAAFRGTGEKGGKMVYLTLICSAVSSGKMTCILRGKGQLFLFLSSEGQFTTSLWEFLQGCELFQVSLHCFF